MSDLKATHFIISFFFIFLMLFLTTIESLSYALSLFYLLMVFFFLALLNPFNIEGAEKERVYIYRKIIGVLSCSVLALGAHFYPQVFRHFWSILFVLLPLVYYSRSQIKNLRDPIFWRVEGYFFIIFSIAIISLSFSPEWGSGEKPMDLNYLNYYSRPGAFTQFDPWFAGAKSSYYSFGFALSGIWAVVSGLTGNEFYLPALSFWLALFFLSIMLIGAKKRIVALVFFLLPMGALLKVFSSFNFLNFWQMTRAYTHPYFSEFPLWSYLFSDLHPHVMSYSLSALLFVYFLDFKRHQLKGLHPFVFSGIFLILFLTNLWDFIFWGFTLSLLGLYDRKEIPLKSAFLNLVIIAMGAFTIISLNPSHHQVTLDLWSLKAWYAEILGGYLLHHSIFLIILTYLCWKKKKSLIFPIVMISFIFSFIQLIDPVNSIFKFQTSFTVLLMLSTLLLLRDVVLSKRWLVFLCLFLGLTTVLTFFQRQADRSENYLSSVKFLEKSQPDMAQLVDFLAAKKFTPLIIVEAVSDSFSYSGALLSTYTGLPSYLGWKNHVRIRGVDSQKILQRSHFITQIYTSKEVEEVVSLLKREGIDLIVLGEKERQKYRGAGLGKFASRPEYFEHLFSSDTTHLFKLRSSERE